MPDLRSLLVAATQQLVERADAEALLLHVLDKPRSWLFSHAGDEPAAAIQAAFRKAVERRLQGEPVAYITGRRGFWSMDLEVTPATLIPRPETELLVELALERLSVGSTGTVVDLGTGSGAIALAIAKERPRTNLVCVDVSVEALAVARSNAKRLGINNVEFLHGDWLIPLSSRRVEMIVSNPPYIEVADPHLAQGDLRFEPVSALASGSDGLDDIRRIIGSAHKHLKPQGWLLFEHGWNQGDVVRKLLKAATFSDAFTAQDLEHRDRVSGARWMG